MQRAFQFALVIAAAAVAASPAHAQRYRHTGISAGGNVQQLVQGYPVPGLGFDYTHHAAINRNFATRALIDPITQHQVAQARSLNSGTAVVGVPVLIGGGTTVVVVQQPPPTIVFQSGDPSRDRDYDQDSGELDARISRLERASYSNRLARLERLERDEAARESAANEAPRDEAATPARSARHSTGSDAPRQSAEILFIRRDGSLLFAVAFTRQRDRIIYISSEGHRRTLALADLDLEATSAMNEARGAELRF